MNTLKQVAFFIFLLAGMLRLNAQSWERIYSTVTTDTTAEFKKVLPSTDGGFLLLLGDGIFGNNHYDIQLLKITGAGAVQWNRHYDFGDLEIPEDLIATSDGGYAIVYQISEGQSSFRSFVLKLDASFNVEFRVEIPEFGTEVINMRARQILERQQQLYIFGTAFLADVGINTGFLYGLDLQGNSLSVYLEWLPLESEFQAATLTPGGNFVVMSNVRDPNVNNYGVSVAQLDEQNGATTWEWTKSEMDIFYQGGDILAVPGGGFLIAGSKNSTGWLTRLDAGGNVVWQKEMSGSNDPDSVRVLGFEEMAVTATADGFWAAGPSPLYIPQIELARFDWQGNLQFHKTLGIFFNYNYARDLLPTPDDGCLVAGTRSLQPNYKSWVPYAIRTDSAGNGFLSGINGTVAQDFDNDCAGDSDTLSYGFSVNVWQNGSFVSSGTVNQLGQYGIGLDTGNYIVTVHKQNNAWSFCPDTLAVTVTAQDSVQNVDFAAFFNPQPVDSVYGHVFEDIDGDCVYDPFEPVYADWSVILILTGTNGPQTFVAHSDSNGYFLFDNLSGFNNTASGYFSLAPPPSDGLNCTMTCQQAYEVQFLNSNSYEANFGMRCDSLPPCPIIEVDIATSVLRPCMTSTYHVHYCNTGSVIAEDVEIVVRIDSALTVTGASIPWTSVSGNAYTFALDDLSPEVCDAFSIHVEVPCDDPLGTTYCVEAHAYPDTICQPPGQNWDGSQIEATAACVGDSVVFTIQNVGEFDMQQVLNYIVTEDNVMLMQFPGAFQLEAGEALTLSYPANGAFWRLETDQSPGLPVLSDPVAWVEGCTANGGVVNLGFVNQFPLPDDEPWLDIFCLESVNSFDPNDKTGFPRGFAAAHFIEQNTDIEYLIRFQNTGTAPAIDIEIRDTIPVQFLDPLTVRPGSSSHPYVWDMAGDGVVRFRFPGINLPDSAANLEASQGFVKFRVSQQVDLPMGTQILNSAAIYFDFNDPVITNQTRHTIGRDFIQTATHNPAGRDVRVTFAPNPMNHRVQVRVAGISEFAPLQFRLVDPLGQTVVELHPAGGAFQFDSTPLPGGVYYYELREGGKPVAAGNLVKLK